MGRLVDERFASFVVEGIIVRPEWGRCTDWIGSKSRAGYGRLLIDGAPVLAHRYAFERLWGKTGLYVLHYCDNPPCTREDHLWAGTQQDNIRDMILKGRRRDGNNREDKRRAHSLYMKATWEARRATVDLSGWKPTLPIPLPADVHVGQTCAG